MSSRVSTVLIGAVGGAVLLSGCGATSLGLGATDDMSGPGASISKRLAALVPANIRSKGTLTIATDASYEPNEFLAPDGQTVIGMDVDLLRTALQKLGLKADFVNAKFDSIITGVVGGKYDLATSSFTVTADREKQVTMVSYFSAGTQWVTAKGNPKKVNPLQPCGLSVGVQTGTTQADEITAINKDQCRSDPVKAVVEDLQSKVTTDLLAGKVDAMAADSPVALYAVKKTGTKLQAVGKITGAAPYGIVLPKAQTDFGNAIAQAFAAMVSDGSYDKTLAKWGQESGAVDMFAVDPAVAS